MRANSTAVMQPSFTDTGRAPDTSYTYMVVSIGSGGARSVPSNGLIVARTAPAPVCTTASNLSTSSLVEPTIGSVLPTPAARTK